jgi:hypothetical protein
MHTLVYKLCYLSLHTNSHIKSLIYAFTHEATNQLIPLTPTQLLTLLHTHVPTTHSITSLPLILYDAVMLYRDIERFVLFVSVIITHLNSYHETSHT